MTSYLLHTHVWAWSMLQIMMPKKVADVVLKADTIIVSAISFYEIRQKVRLGKWPEMMRQSTRLQDIITSQSAGIADITAVISDLAGAMEWDHRDPFDRMIAATSITLKLPLISADTAFDALSHRPDWPGRVWL